ncbi:MAG: hypothetical protein WAX69_05325, partial [Victivallales bacterium]
GETAGCEGGRQIDSPLIAWIISLSCQSSWQGAGECPEKPRRYGTANMRIVDRARPQKGVFVDGL